MIKERTQRLTRVAMVLVTILALGAVMAFTGTENDDFEDGTTMGWDEGGPSPNPPTNIADGGPGGAGARKVRQG